ncbi:MAG: UbiD family decarboxylase, partial [Deltaproteobacteria bacterium]|nr:UbiD family decarboxylase [Deltaproteobacteria bacterium]
MKFNQLKEFIQYLEEQGQLKRISIEVDPYLQITEIADRVMKMPGGGKALLFEKVKGSDFPLLINAYGSYQRMSWALGVPDMEDQARRLQETLNTQTPQSFWEKLKILPKAAELARSLPKSRSSGPCQEKIWETVDLSKLPILHCWPKDGGAFITLPMVITKDPETGRRNVGLYRMQVLDKTSTAMHWQIHKVGKKHFEAYKKRGEKIPVAVAIGGDPVLTYTATAPLPEGIDEFLFAGFLKASPVEMVKCKSIDLEVPASADFILEGYIDPTEAMVDEGPFGDHTGYYTPVEKFPRFHVTQITSRKDPIYLTT